MIRRLTAHFNDLHEPTDVSGRALNRLDEALRAQVIGAGARHNNPLAVEQLQCQLV